VHGAYIGKFFAGKFGQMIDVDELVPETSPLPCLSTGTTTFSGEQSLIWW
jgi:hypothetical protein